MLIERQKKKLTAIRRMRKIANRPAKHRALQHSAHASLRAFFPLELFVDRSVYLPRRPAVSFGFETGQRYPSLLTSKCIRRAPFSWGAIVRALNRF